MVDRAVRSPSPELEIFEGAAGLQVGPVRIPLGVIGVLGNTPVEAGPAGSGLGPVPDMVFRFA